MRTHLVVLSLITLAGLAACNPGHGKHTQKHLLGAMERQNAMKAGNEHEQARQSYLAGELEKADKFINRCIQLKPDVPKSYILKGRIMIELSDLEQALLAFQQAEALDPANIDAQYYQGIVYERFAQSDKALKHFSAAADAEPANPQYAIAVAETMIDLGNLDEAEKFLTSRAASFEHSAGIKQTLGHVAMLRKDTEAAVKLFNEARLLASDDQSILEDLIQAQIQSERFADAEFNLSRLLKMKGNAGRRDLLHFRAKCLSKLDRPLEARDVLIELTSSDEGQRDIQAWIELGNVCYSIKDMNRSRQAWQRIVAIAPHRHEGWMLKALYQRRTGDLEGALKTVDRAIERRGTSVDPLVLEGLILSELGRAEEARAAFAAALEEQPEDPAARSGLANVIDDATGDGR